MSSSCCFAWACLCILAFVSICILRCCATLTVLVVVPFTSLGVQDKCGNVASATATLDVRCNNPPVVNIAAAQTFTITVGAEILLNGTEVCLCVYVRIIGSVCMSIRCTPGAPFSKDFIDAPQSKFADYRSICLDSAISRFFRVFDSPMTLKATA